MTPSFLYFLAIIFLLLSAAAFFLILDFINYFRGKRDTVKKEELNFDDDVVIQDLADEFNASANTASSKRTLSVAELQSELAKTGIASDIQKRILQTAEAQNQRPYSNNSHSNYASNYDRTFRYSAVLYFWIAAILFFGLTAALIMPILYPKDASNNPLLNIILTSSTLYFLFLAWAPSKRIAFDSKHVWIGKNENNLFCEKDFTTMYYMNFRFLILFKIEKRYSLLVFRKKDCFVPFAYFLDRFFPAHNSRRQVVFFNTWKEEDGRIANDALLVQEIIKRCDQNGVKVKYWPWEAQFFLILLFLASLFTLWILLR